MRVIKDVYLFFSVTFFVFSCVSLIAQSNHTTKLPEVDSIQIYALGNQAYALRTSNPDSAFLLANQALVLAEKFENIPSQVSLWRIKGIIHAGLGASEAALDNYNKALKLAKEGNFMVGRVLNSIGVTYYRMEDYNAAIETYEASLDYAIEQGDTIPQIDALNNLGSAYSMSGQFDNAIAYYEKSLALQRAANNQTIELTTMTNIGLQYNRKNDLKRGISYLEDGVKIAKERKDSIALANFHRFIAIGYRTNGYLEKALESYQNELIIREAMGDKIGMAKAMNSIAIILQDNDDLDEALRNFEKALLIAEEQNNPKQQAQMLSSIGSNYALRKQCDTALTYFRRSVVIYEAQQINISVYKPLYRMGTCYEQMNQLDSATFYLNQAYDLAKSVNDNISEARILTALGKVNLKLDQSNLAIQNFRQAIQAAQAEGLRKEESEASYGLYRVLAEQGQYQEALKYIEQHQALKDSIFNEESTKQIARLEASYEFEQEKQALVRQNEQEKQALDTRIRKQRTWQVATALALAICLLIFFLVYRFQRLKQRIAVEQEQLKAAIQGQQLKLEQDERVRLEEMDTFKSRFFTDISHELRTPLTIINGMAGQIKAKPERWLTSGTDIIQENTQNLLELVNQILDLRKLESNQHSINLIQADVHKYLKSMAVSYASLAENKGVFLNMNIPSNPLMMDFDPDKFTKIVSNLLSNAIKFTSEKGVVTLSADTEQQQLKVRVEDTGIGIPSDQIPHIFDRYYQVENGNTHNPQGIGIGLALTQELANLLGGIIDVESKEGKGSSFTLYLPISSQTSIVKIEHPVKQKSQSTAISLSESKQKEDLPKLLIVEDNKDMRIFLMACLEEHYQLSFAQDGQEGIDKAIEEIPDIIISDVMMPIKDGYELCAMLKQDLHTSHIPIILLTAKADIEARLSGLEKGADVYLNKPFVEKELLLQLSNLLKVRQQLQEHYRTLDLKENPKNTEDEFLQNVQQKLEKHLDDTNYGTTQLCKAINLSRAQLHNKLKALTGLSTALYIRSFRLKKAKELLENSELNVSEIAYAVGFKTPKYFSSAYSQEFGVAPSVAKK